MDLSLTEERKTTMTGVMVLPDIIRGMSKSTLLDLRLVPLELLKEGILKRDTRALQYLGTKYPGDQWAKYSTLNLE